IVIRRHEFFTLFPYTTLFRSQLLEQLKQGPQPVCLLIPQGRISAGVEDWLQQALPVGQPLQRGALTLCTLSFLSQSQYDRLLARSEEHTSELQSRENLVCRLL